MRVIEVKPTAPASILPGAQFADAWQLSPAPAQLDLNQLAIRIGGASPGWVTKLLKLRDMIVKPFGLTTAEAVQRPGQPFFPMISSDEDRIVLGLNDRHLDFRLVIEKGLTQDGQPSTTTTTFVRTHNLGGRLYLFVVKPFHRIIVPAMMRRAIASRVQ
jgi:hypothetical protein